jgi:hypothetical protein
MSGSGLDFVETFVFLFGLLVLDCGAKGVCPGRFPIILEFGDGIVILGAGLFLLRGPPPPLPEEFVANDRAKGHSQQDGDDNDEDNVEW